MNIIRINNDYSYLITDDKKLRTKLWSGLRFRQRNYFHTKLYRMKLWDGYIDFFNQNNGRFLTGLLVEILEALRELGVQYTIQDEREHVHFIHRNIDNQFLNQWLPKGMRPVTLKDYQVDLINGSVKYRRGIVKAPTGGGKSYILIGILKSLPPNTPTLVLGNRKTVVNQNYREIVKWGFPDVGKFDGKTHEPKTITCATVQSLHHLEPVLHTYRAVFVDEVHMMMASQAIKIYKKLTGCSVRIAISATPFKFQMKRKGKKTVEGDQVHKYSVKGYFGPVLMTRFGELTIEMLQQMEQLSKSQCIFYPIREPHIPFDIYLDAVTNGLAQSWHFHKTVVRLASKLKGRTLIMVERLAHGDALHQLIPNSLWIQGKDDEQTRLYVIDQLQNAKDDVVAIATSGIFNAGVNFFCHNLINAAGGKASHDITQRIGRGLRTADDKDILKYYDFMFLINPYLEKHSKERVAVLQGDGHEVEIKEVDF